MLNLPKPEDPQWRDRVIQMLEQLIVDRDRLLKHRTDVFPQSYFGLVPPTASTTTTTTTTPGA